MTERKRRIPPQVLWNLFALQYAGLVGVIICAVAGIPLAALIMSLVLVAASGLRALWEPSRVQTVIACLSPAAVVFSGVLLLLG